MEGHKTPNLKNRQSFSKSEDVAEVPEVNKIHFDLEKCFRSIVDGLSIELDIITLNNILNKDLQISSYYLNPKLQQVIPYMIVHHIKSWPGWQRSNVYFNKQITFNSWYKRFREYLVFKINYLIKNDFDKVLKTNPLGDCVLDKIDNSTQTESSEKPVAQYYIHVQGSPKMLNSLVFCEEPNGDIILKEYKVKPFPDKLTIEHLLNWPYVVIKFKSEELKFERKNMHEYKRYVMLGREKITAKKIGSLIEEIEIINEKSNRSVYTLNALREYCDTYVNIMRKHQTIMEINEEYINDVAAIFKEFLLDIEALNMNSMATNSSVLFNLSKFVYARNKSLRTGGNEISFAESIVPKIEIRLYSFTGIKNPNCDIPFQLLHEILLSTDKEFITKILPTIEYGCTYCQTYFNTKVDLLSHFMAKHSMEQPVLCFFCKSQLNVMSLCQDRWSHKCTLSNVSI